MNQLLSIRSEGFQSPGKGNKPEVWSEIYGAVQNSLVLKALACGLENHQTPGVGPSGEIVLREQPCLVLFPGDNVKVLIPFISSGAKRENDLRNLLGSQVEYKVQKIDREANLVIGSRQEALDHLKGLTLRQIKEGSTWTATVRWVGRNYAVLDLGGLTSTLKPHEFGYGFIEDMREYVKVGDVLEVFVKKVDLEGERVKISRKELCENPWNHVPQRYQIGGVYLARITGQADYGYFITFEPGVYGVVKFPRYRRYEVGEQTVVRIREIDMEKERIKGTIQE